ncbi:MAG: peptidase M20, partial [Thermocrispum sp.]
MGAVDIDAAYSAVRRHWNEDILPSLCGLVEIPALSPAFDADWATSGQLDAAVDHVRKWLDARGIEGATSQVVRLPGRTPVLLLDVPATPTLP